MKRVAYFTNIAPHYRERLWLNLCKEEEFDIHFYFDPVSRSKIKSIDFTSTQWVDYSTRLHHLKNVSFKGRIVFQLSLIRNVLFKKWDALIFLGDANLISTWIAVPLARLLGKRIIFWGHGLYGSEKGLQLLLRKTFLSMANYNLVYGNWAKSQMIKHGIREESIDVIYNSLDYDQSKNLREQAIDENFYGESKFFNNSSKTLIFIGRLTSEKRIHLIFDALEKLKNQNKYFNLLIVGDGEEREKLSEIANKLNLSVCFFGACYDEKVISKLISNADLCVSPGNVGLTAIHALSYGTPVCTHGDFTQQMPEVESIVEGDTGCFFDLAKEDLAETIDKWFSKVKSRDEVRRNCYSRIDSFFNPNIQVEIIKKALAFSN